MSAESVRLLPVSGLATDPVERARFDAWAEVFTVAGRHDAAEEPETADELRVKETDETRLRLREAAVAGDCVVGGYDMILPLRDNQRVAYFVLTVHPDHRRRGIGTMLLTSAEAVAAEHDRTNLVSETSWLGDDHRVGDTGGDFARRFGYAPAQTLRRSDYTVPGTGPEVPPAPQGYAVETCLGTPPPADRADRVRLARRMSTDAPMGDLDFEEEEWDEAAIAAHDERLVTMGRGRVNTFARHLESGRLVAFTEIQVPKESRTLAYQEDTLVLREHRGRGLGLILKVTNLARLRTAYPDIRTVRTWNAVENAHMLAVNDAMGYATSGFVREWQKRR
jgi:GNAT superfamily N-acetyltransferase